MTEEEHRNHVRKLVNKESRKLVRDVLAKPAAASCSSRIREEVDFDAEAIGQVHGHAFPSWEESMLVRQLRDSGNAAISLVAEWAEQIVGHILFSPVSIRSGSQEVVGLGLGPMAVLPKHQRQGIGSELVRAGMAKADDLGYPFVVVLGHPEFYPRFGFQPAKPLGITCEWDVPDNAFMILRLDDESMNGVTGLARYRQEFSELST